MVEEKRQRERFLRAIDVIQRIYRGHKGKEMEVSKTSHSLTQHTHLLKALTRNALTYSLTHFG